MENKYLLVNIGSTTVRYALYEGIREIARMRIEQTPKGRIATFTTGTTQIEIPTTEDSNTTPFLFFLNTLKTKSILTTTNELQSIGIRIVAPGAYFLPTQIITEAYTIELKKVQKVAPLHIYPLLAEIAHITSSVPTISLVGISDSAFHHTMTPEASVYALPEKYRTRIPRFGYHGVSLGSITAQMEKIAGGIPKNTIICHLGGGSSITAVQNGNSIDTSMGFSPLEGVTMGTRVGTIDAGALLYLQERYHLSSKELSTLLQEHSGLLGLSGDTADVRTLIQKSKDGNKNADTALTHFTYSVQKYIGSYIAILGKLDMLVFTGTIGERSHFIRERICRRLSHLGISIDDINTEEIHTTTFIHNTSASVRVAVIPTNEMQYLATQLDTYFRT